DPTLLGISRLGAVAIEKQRRRTVRCSPHGKRQKRTARKATRMVEASALGKAGVLEAGAQSSAAGDRSRSAGREPSLINSLPKSLFRFRAVNFYSDPKFQKRRREAMSTPTPFFAPLIVDADEILASEIACLD